MKINKVVAFFTTLCFVLGTITYVLHQAEIAFAETVETYNQTLINDDFENGMPEEINIQSGMGDVSVDNVCGQNSMSVTSNVDGGYTKAMWNFKKVKSGVANINFDFCLPEDVIDSGVIMAVATDNASLLAVEIKGSDVVVNNGNNSVVLKSSYETGVWYNVDFVLDIDGKSFTAVLDELPESEQTGSWSGLSFDSIYTLAEYTGSYALDNVKVVREVQVGEKRILGNEKISIPKIDSRDYTYTVFLAESNGEEIDVSDFEWQLQGAYSGVSVSESDEQGAIITVTSEATSGSIGLKALHYTDGVIDVSIETTIDLLFENVGEIKIIGDTHLCSLDGKTKEYQYQAFVYDSFGNKMNGEMLEWYILPESDVISINPSTGLVTLSGAMPKEDMLIDIYAQTSNGEMGRKRIVVQPRDAYYNDTMRLEAVKDSIDFILKNASHPNGENPLISGFLSPSARRPGEIFYISQDTPTQYSELTMNMELHRAMVGLSNLTDDESYAERVGEMYKWYLDKGVSKDDLLYVGNHQSFDLKTGERSVYYQYFDSNKFMEIEDRDFYSEPFMQQDKDKYLKFCEAFWANCITDFATMGFNRHTVVSEKATDYTRLDQIDVFDDSYKDNVVNGKPFPYVPYLGLSFMSTGNILLKTARDAVENGGNQNLKTWGYRLIRRYLDTVDPDTGMFGTQFTSPMFHPGKLDLVAKFGEEWWTTEEGMTASKSYDYGDRAYNSFAQTCVNNGLITEDEMTEIVEAALLNSSRIAGRFAYECYEFAELLGTDTPEGYEIIEDYTKCLASWIKHAYNPKTNKFKVVFTNGVDFTGVRWERSGYWGSAGNSFKEFTLEDECLITMLRACEATKDFPELEEEYNVIIEFLDKYLDNKYRIGSIGDPLKNIEPSLKLNVNTTDTILIRILVKLYDISGNQKYLKLARVVGNNIVVKTYKQNMFIKDSKLRYVPIDGETEYVLLLLEQAILDEDGVVPQSSYTNGYEHQGYFISQQNNSKISWSNPEILTWKYRDVNVTRIIPDVTEIVLRPGETHKINLTIQPDDATSKGVFWEIDDKSILSINESNVVMGQKTGSTVIRAVSKSTLGVVSEPIVVTISE